MDRRTECEQQTHVIKPRNLYYLLAYAFRIRPDSYATMGSEEFDNHLDVMASVIGHAMDSVIRKGMIRSYTPHSETTSKPHGRIDLRESIRTLSLPNNKVVCDFELYDHLTYENRIVASTIMDLISDADLNDSIRANLRRTLRAMGDPGTVDIHTVDWSRVQTPRDRDFAMALNACRLVAECMIPDENGEGRKGRRFLNEGKESSLYEEFVRGYFRVEHPDIYSSRRKMDWTMPSESRSALIPSMEMDILLHSGNKALIIDTKCYKRSLDEHWETKVFNPGNIYQINTYVDNWKDENPSDTAAGMLLYAYDGVDEFSESQKLAKNLIHFRTLNLNGEWQDIKRQLDDIAALL